MSSMNGFGDRYSLSAALLRPRDPQRADAAPGRDGEAAGIGSAGRAQLACADQRQLVRIVEQSLRQLGIGSGDATRAGNAACGPSAGSQPSDRALHALTRDLLRALGRADSMTGSSGAARRAASAGTDGDLVSELQWLMRRLGSEGAGHLALARLNVAFACIAQSATASSSITHEGGDVASARASLLQFLQTLLQNLTGPSNARLEASSPPARA